jgi:hypothetical protein
MHNVRLDRHAAMVATAASRITAESHRHRTETRTRARSTLDAAVRTRQTNASGRAGRRTSCDGH